jgi:N-acetylmuramic acid 6-phosphate etherase
MNAADRAGRFVREETEFHLGFLPTEQSHPATRDFSRAVQADTRAGLRLLLSVDGDIPPVAEQVLGSEAWARLEEAFRSCAAAGGRICFSGCGSTGRLAIILETLWRRFWTRAAADFPAQSGLFLTWADQACSIMTGGDRALIKSVESFEDFQTFGRRQVRDARLGRGDLLIAVSEGGETSSVIGTARQALDSGARVFFVFNNPAALLAERIERSRELINHPSVTCLDLTTGPMALSGSTRMQATSIELLVIGAALEQAACRLLREALPPGKPWPPAGRLLPSPGDYAPAFRALLAGLNSPPALNALAALTELEEAVYRGRGLVTYLASGYLLDIFCDTSERTPTFMLPGFRRAGDTASPPSWAFARHPLLSTRETWDTMLRRPPRGLDWGAADYEEMKAPTALRRTPPGLDKEEIYRYMIGCEQDASRCRAPGSALMLVRVADGRPEDEDPALPRAFARRGAPCARRLDLIIAPPARADGYAAAGPDHERLLLPLIPEPTPMYLFYHLAVKLIFNTFSTATMGRMGRIRGNWMIQVATSNKKLIDRSARIIAGLAGLSYSQACRELFLTMEHSERDPGATTSHVVATLDRLGISG